jgi:rhodanese-related sulfurtransferase
MANIVDLSFEDIEKGLADDTILLVDVREPHEFAAGHVPGSVSMPLSTFDPSNLPDAGDRRIVFSCAAGVRSLRALAMAQMSGEALNEHYIGGFKDWLYRGGPVEV